MKTIILITATLILGFSSLKSSAQPVSTAELNITFSPERNSTTAGYKEFDVFLAAGTGYVTNDNLYSPNTTNLNGSWTGISFKFEQSVSFPFVNTDFIATSTGATGITNGETVAAISIGGCYTNGAFQLNLFRNSPGIDANATPYIVGTISYPDTHAGQTLSVRPTSTQLCAGRESFWSNGDVDNGNTRLTIANNGTSIVLPVTISSLSAKMANCAGLINWSTTGESNLSSYGIESSTDATHFKQAGQVAARNISTASNYSFTDYNLASGSVYYRIRSVELNGSSKLSEVVNVKNTCNQNKIQIFPNPTKDLVIVRGITAGNTINICDAEGKLLSSSISTTNSAAVSISQYAKGIYIVNVLNGAAAITTIKVVKE